mmetsp:Transcript_174/g.447  ORF Transcript_174/g.447 Transcript_174/m.447 type:complete len:336 (-) Transcript_174:316-1323(-)|eukprot:CAMPEP_0198129612 /NCGR_PEP_ID=MMETSP1442-20131203/52129_1 /TAXON_ID= /ORGANISM="Craspedostauros australis, Strain CCMP3328" /LENGTH=335 /DNA_ID=CAMNT_0043790039 /DNA_START=94 /DNA_END=1101 /DNA_ORIENTATION=-
MPTHDSNTVKCTHLVTQCCDDEDGSECCISYLENVLSPADAAAVLTELEQQIPWKVEVDDFGPQSRPTAYFADSEECVFTYVGLRLEASKVVGSSGDGGGSSVEKDRAANANHNIGGSSSKANGTAGMQECGSCWTPTLLRLRKAVASACGISEADMTACLANLYREGTGHIPWHYDEVRAHGEKKIIAALSLGGPRVFEYRRKNASIQGEAGDGDGDGGIGESKGGDGQKDDYVPVGPSGSVATQPETDTKDLKVHSIRLQPGSVLLMRGRTQEFFEHRLPLSKDATDEASLSKTTLDPLRISLTFRSIVPGFEDEQAEIAKDVCCVDDPGYRE